MSFPGIPLIASTNTTAFSCVVFMENEYCHALKPEPVVSFSSSLKTLLLFNLMSCVSKGTELFLLQLGVSWESVRTYAFKA